MGSVFRYAGGCRLAEWRKVPGLLAGALSKPLEIF